MISESEFNEFEPHLKFKPRLKFFKFAFKAFYKKPSFIYCSKKYLVWIDQWASSLNLNQYLTIKLWNWRQNFAWFYFCTERSHDCGLGFPTGGGGGFQIFSDIPDIVGYPLIEPRGNEPNVFLTQRFSDLKICRFDYRNVPNWPKDWKYILVGY